MAHSLVVVCSRVVLIATFMLPGPAGFAAVVPPNPSTTAEEVIAADIAAQNVGEWNTFLKLRSDMPGAPENASGYEVLWQQGPYGIRGNVTSARVESIAPIPFEVAREIISPCCYADHLKKPAAFYVIIDYGVRREDKYVCNGPNARLYVLDHVDDHWKIVEVSEPPLASLVNRGFGTGSPSERELLDRQRVRLQTGQFLNTRGEVILADSPNATIEAHQFPSSIIVAHYTAYPDCKYQSLIGAIDFMTYVKDVVPNEWPSSFPSQSLKAGAITAKMVGWYRRYNAKYPNRGYDVSDQDCDQVYRAGSAVTATNNAVCGVSGVGFDRADGTLFYASYSAGSYNGNGYHGGQMYQNGTRYLADLGYQYQDMVYYYYDSSSATGGQLAHIFTYADSASCGGGNPTVIVTSPVGGENWQTGTSHDVTWSVSGSTGSISYWKVALSTDGGASWPTATDDPRQLSGGIFNTGARSWTWPIDSSWNTTQARIRVRALDVNANILGESVSPANFTISSPESIVTPSTPSGPTSGSASASYSFSMGGSSSNLGHSVQYQIDWGDGQTTGWLPVGTTSTSHAWSSSGSYSVRAQARCAAHTTVVSGLSNVLSVTISSSETISTPAQPSGPTSGGPGSSYTYSASGSSSSLGHSVQYQFDWGDGQLSGWLPVGTTSAAHSWSSAGTYSVTAQTRCATHTSIRSGNASSVPVVISPIVGGSDLIVDGGFEQATATGNSAPGWDGVPSAPARPLIIANGSYPHVGANYASLAGADGLQGDFVIQIITIPSEAAAANLTLWVNVTTQEALNGPVFDFFWVALYDLSGNLIGAPLQLTNQDAMRSNNTLGSYFQVGPIDLLSYRGTPIQLALVAQTDGSLPTTFLVDDVSLHLTGSDNAPTTAITFPVGGATVSSTVNIAATASDDHAVTSLEILIDGAVRASIANASSMFYSWNTTQESNGQHTVVSRAGDGAGHSTTSSPVTVTVSNLAAPANVAATATSDSQVIVTWTPVAGAAGYQVLRSSNNQGYVLAGTPSGTSFTDAGLVPNTTYLYLVRAVDASNNVGPGSLMDPATTTMFTEDPVTAWSTTVRALHLAELRIAVNALRVAAGLQPITFTEAIVPGVMIRSLHIVELRSALNTARAQLSLNPLTYTDPSLTSGTVVKAAHVTDLRSGVK
jgi:hypothetical protein